MERMQEVMSGLLYHPSRYRRWSIRLAAALLTLSGYSAGAIVIYGGSGVDAPANNTAPAGFEDAWARVGSNGNGTGVYLGNGMVLTARHVDLGDGLEIDGLLYERINTQLPLKNPDNSDTDLRIYRIAVPNDTPLFNLDPLAIASTSQATFVTNNQTEGILIGTGVGQTTLQPISLAPEGGPSGNGFVWDSDATREKRWVEAEIGSPTDIQVPGLNPVDEGFLSQFRFFNGQDGAASQNDSGAGLFYDDNGVITLAGLVHSVTRLEFSRQNDQTFLSDLAEYADQIIVTPHDLDADGGVGQGDLDLVLSNFGNNVQAGNFLQGDVNGDGLVGITDVDIILANWGNGFGQSIAAPVGVPEPTSLVLLSGALLAFSNRPRRRR